MTFSPEVWGDVLRRLQDQIPDFAFDAWIAPLSVKTSGDRLLVGCPTSFHRDRVQRLYADAIRDGWRASLSQASGQTNAEASGQTSGQTSGQANAEAGIESSAGSEVAAGRAASAPIELVTMKEFEVAPGRAIEVRLPARRTGADDAAPPAPATITPNP